MSRLMRPTLLPAVACSPRFWRLFAEAMSTVGMALEIATGVYPQHFLVLASLGHLCISVGRTMGKPVFRIIQNRE